MAKLEKITSARASFKNKVRLLIESVAPNESSKAFASAANLILSGKKNPKGSRRARHSFNETKGVKNDGNR
jgi:hypothetical protein